MSTRSRPAPPEPDRSTGPDDARYRALCSRDRRFDGRFFTGITSTGIYCRPVCAVRTPRRENCRFFDHAAQAEQAGFRPCLRCRPELAPAERPWSTQDAGDILLQHALRWLDDPAQHQVNDGSTLTRLAERLGVSRVTVRNAVAKLVEDAMEYTGTRVMILTHVKELLEQNAKTLLRIAPQSDIGFYSASIGQKRLPGPA